MTNVPTSTNSQVERPSGLTRLGRGLAALVDEQERHPVPPSPLLVTVAEQILSKARPGQPVRKPRRPTLANLLKQAAKVGKSVKGAEVYPDRVVLQFGEPTPINANPWDEVLIDAADQKRPS